jgi:hypothetical protein
MPVWVYGGGLRLGRSTADMEHPRADSERGGDAGGDGMNTLILYAMGIASLVVIIAGAFTVVVMIVYYIQVMWSKISACAKNTMEYLQNKQDFEVYKADVLHWDMVKREKALRCRECAYRKKYMDEEAQP